MFLFLEYFKQRNEGSRFPKLQVRSEFFKLERRWKTERNSKIFNYCSKIAPV